MLTRYAIVLALQLTLPRSCFHSPDHEPRALELIPCDLADGVQPFRARVFSLHDQSRSLVSCPEVATGEVEGLVLVKDDRFTFEIEGPAPRTLTAADPGHSCDPISGWEVSFGSPGCAAQLVEVFER